MILILTVVYLLTCCLLSMLMCICLNLFRRKVYVCFWDSWWFLKEPIVLDALRNVIQDVYVPFLVENPDCV